MFPSSVYLTTGAHELSSTTSQYLPGTNTFVSLYNTPTRTLATLERTRSMRERSWSICAYMHSTSTPRKYTLSVRDM